MPSFIHSWGDEDSLPTLTPPLNTSLSGPMAADALTERRKGRRLLPSPHGPGWKRVKSRAAVVNGDVDPALIKAAAVYAEELYVMLRSYLGGPDMESTIKIRLFQDELQFRSAAMRDYAPTAEAYYNPADHQISLSISRYGSQELFETAFAHEFTHAYVDTVFGKSEPIWLMEGIAEWFSNLTWRGGIFVPGQTNRRALWNIASRLIPLSLHRLLQLTRDEIYGPGFQYYYSQAWSVVDFLMTELPHRNMEELLLQASNSYDHLERYQEEWIRHVDVMMERAGYQPR